MMMPAAPGTPLEVVEAEFVFEFLVGVLDPPATLRKPDEFLSGCRGRQVREEGSSAEFVGRKPGFLRGALPRTPRFMSHGTGISLSLSA